MSCGQTTGSRCEPICDTVFKDVAIYPQHNGSTLVTWEFMPNQGMPSDTVYRLEFGYGETPDAWQVAAATGVGVTELLDVPVRVKANYSRLHYRIRASRPSLPVVYSAPRPMLYAASSLSERRVISTIIQREHTPTALRGKRQGVLLRRRREGTRCLNCLDSYQDLSISSQCLDCYGTGWVAGYYTPILCYYARKGKVTTEAVIDEQQGPTEGPDATSLLVFNKRMAASHDVWVDHRTDERWLVKRVTPQVVIGTVPLGQQLDVVRIPTSDLIYQVPIPQNLPIT